MVIKDKITKTSNITDNDSLSGFMGRAAQQSHNVYEIFYDFITEVKPHRILEIGTALGGFTEFLRIITNDLGLQTEILSYDIAVKPWYQDMIKKGIDVRVENIFNSDYSEVKKEVIEFIKKDGITIVLCDGGYKIGEFNLLSNYIKEGDFIMAHDYSPSLEFFKENIQYKIWNWCEITDNNIDDCSKKNKLHPYKQDTFNNCVWVCKQKLNYE